MTDLTVSADGRRLQRGSDPAFVVADTVWSAFADATVEEWRYHVRHRAEQGFTTMLVSALPILHDRAVREGAREPFELDEAGHYRFDAPDDEYWRTAELFAGIARDAGLDLGLVLLWCNYVGGTWGAERNPWGVMPDADRERYLRATVERFSPYRPMFIVSGDDRFDGETARGVYLAALRQVKALAPECLTTMHSTPDAELPAAIADAPELDFYAYQAGHLHDEQDRAHTLAAHYLSRPVRRPIMDLEPCYEGHGYGGGLGRYRREDVRRATWWSIVGGASAGVGYGAHGVWQWFRAGARFTSPEFSLEPFDWRTAAAFAGADDVGFAGALVRDAGLVGAEPAPGVLRSTVPGMLAARSADTGATAIYLPDPREVRLDPDLDARGAVLWDLAGRRALRPRFATDHDALVLRQPDTLADLLLVLG
jgi:hypothetical protein